MDFQEMFFSFDGRLNRKPYILRFLLRNAIIWCLGLSDRQSVCARRNDVPDTGLCFDLYRRAQLPVALRQTSA